jgi:MFS family permease
VDLSVKSLFKDYLFLEPSQTQSLNTIIGLPWTIRFLYGIISDSLPIFGSRKRGYYILMSILAIVFLIPLMFPAFLNTYAIAALLVLNNVALAFNDVITDSIIVLQSRIDPKSGAKVLNSYARSLQAAGGIVGSFSAAYMTQYTDPHYAFLIQGILSVFIVYSGFILNRNLDADFRN